MHRVAHSIILLCSTQFTCCPFSLALCLALALALFLDLPPRAPSLTLLQNVILNTWQSYLAEGWTEGELDGLE